MDQVLSTLHAMFHFVIMTTCAWVLLSPLYRSGLEHSRKMPVIRQVAKMKSEFNWDLSDWKVQAVSSPTCLSKKDLDKDFSFYLEKKSNVSKMLYLFANASHAPCTSLLRGQVPKLQSPSAQGAAVSLRVDSQSWSNIKTQLHVEVKLRSRSSVKENCLLLKMRYNIFPISFWQHVSIA